VPIDGTLCGSDSGSPKPSPGGGGGNLCLRHATPSALGSNALGSAVAAFLAMPKSSMLVVPLVEAGVVLPPRYAGELPQLGDHCDCAPEWRCDPHDACFIHDSCFCDV